MSSVPLLSASDLCVAPDDLPPPNSPTGAGALHGVTLVVHAGAGLCLFTGGHPSAGHHRLLSILSLMETAKSGVLQLKGESTAGWSESQRAEARNRHFGFLFHSPFLLPAFNVLENIAIPCVKQQGASASPEILEGPTRRVLKLVGLEAHAEAAVDDLPLPLQHRTALARALINQPSLVIIERIDDLLKNGDLIAFLELLATVSHKLGTTFLLSSDTPGLAGFTNRVVELEAGQIVADRTPKRFFPKQ